MLDEDGVTGQVAVDDGRVTRVEITAEEVKGTTSRDGLTLFRPSAGTELNILE